MIEAVVRAIAKAARLREEGKHENAIEEASRVWDEVLGVPRELVDRMDARSLAQLLRDPDKIRVASKLLAEESLAHRGCGDVTRAESVMQLSRTLEIEADRNT